MSLFYLIFLALAAYYSFRYDWIEEHDSHKLHRLWFMCFYLICLTGFSYGLGADKFTYMEEFEQYPDNFSDAGDEIWAAFMFRGQMPLWTIVNLTCKSLFHSFYAVQLLESTAINITVCYLVSKYTHRYFLFLIIYFLSLQYFIFNTEVMREGFAMSFALIGIHGWLSGKKWLYFLTLPIGIMFHISASIVLLLPIAKFKITWKTLLYAFATSFIIWGLSTIVLSRIFSVIAGGMGAFVAKALIYAVQATNIFGFIRFISTYLIFPFIIMYTVTLNEPSDEIRKRKEKLIAFMILLGIIAGTMPGLIRFFNYVQIFYLIMLSDFIYTFTRSKDLFLIRVGTLAGTILVIVMLYTIHYKSTNTYFYNFFYPYTCILNETDDVYIREVAHIEALVIEDKEDNVRNLE